MRKIVEVRTSAGKSQRLRAGSHRRTPEVKTEIADWLAKLLLASTQVTELKEKSMPDAIDDLFRRFGKAFNKADVEEIAACVTDDFEWRLDAGGGRPARC